MTRIMSFLLALVALPVLAEMPSRVVSMNLCTDQLAIMLAAEGQLVSVSDWSTRPEASNTADAAKTLHVNTGSAEQIFLLKPDLVLAGTFTNRVSIDMLRRLGVRVELFSPPRSIAEVSDKIERLGALLGREAAATALNKAFMTSLDREATRARNLPRDSAAYHYPNSFTSGANTLASEVLARAGFDNAAAELGLTGAVRLDLETLVMARPFVIRTSAISGTAIGRAYETAAHPALAAVGADGRSATVAQRWQICGTPFVVQAIAALIDARLTSDDVSEGR